MSDNDPILTVVTQRTTSRPTELIASLHRWPSRITRRWLAFMSLPILGMISIVLVIDFSTNGVVLVGLSHSTTHRDWFLALNKATSYFPSGLWSTVTLLGDGAVLLLVLTPMLCANPKAWWAAVSSAPFAGAYSALGKEWAAVPRPAAVLDHTTFTIIGDALTGSNSFPSGHSITVFAALAAVLATLSLRSRWQQSTLVLGGITIASIVCVSRVAVGAHWPLDLLAGAFGGSLAGLVGAALVHRLSSPSERLPDSVKRWGTSAVLISLSVSILIEPYPGSYAVTVSSLAALIGLTVSARILLRAARHGDGDYGSTAKTSRLAS